MKLKTWLKAGRGRAVALAKYLDVSKSMVSQMAAEKSPIPIPPTMYRRIKEFTRGEVDYEDMIPGAPASRQPVSNPSDRRGTQPDRRQRDVPVPFDMRGTKPDRRDGATAQG